MSNWTKSTQSPTAWQRLKLAVAAGAGLIGFDPTTSDASYGTSTLGRFLKRAFGLSAAEVTAGTTPTNYYAQALPVLDLRRYCTLDGVADDTTGLNNALAVVTAAGGGMLIHPPGTLRITAQVPLPANLIWQGCGNDVSKILVDAAVIGFRKAYANHSAVNAFHLVMSNLGIIGTSTAVGGMKIDYADWLHLDKVRFKDFTAANAYGVELVNCYRWKITGGHFENIKKYGLKCTKDGSGVGCNLGKFSRNEVIGNNQTGFIGVFLAGQQLEIDGNDFEGSGNGLRAIDMDGTEGVHIHDNYIELWQDTDGSCIRMAAGAACKRTLIEQNVINGVAPCIQLTNASVNDRVTVRHNRFPDIGAGADLIVPGTSTRFIEYGNDPDTSDITDTYTASANDVTEQTGTFTGTLTGCTTSPTGSITFEKRANSVTLTIPNISATSNTNACTVTGMPSRLYPAATQTMVGRNKDNGVDRVGLLQVSTAGVITLFDAAGNSTTFTTTGTKGIGACTVTYSLS